MVERSPYAAGGYMALKLEPHLHTVHSDGEDTIAAMFAACKSTGYDAVALTDHNTLSGMPEAERAAHELGLILIPGVEVTTFRGHAVVLGVSRVPEWRDLEARGMDALAADVHARGGVFSVAHPASVGSPVCSGCTWEWSIQPAAIDHWEVFAETPGESAQAQALWHRLLERGANIAPAGVGDVHSTSAAAAARPATYVFTQHRSPEAVLDGLRRRRVCATRGRPIEFWLDDGSHPAFAGATVSAGEWTPRASDGAIIQELKTSTKQRCLYAELRDAQGQLDAVSAPIWIDSSH